MFWEGACGSHPAALLWRDRSWLDRPRKDPAPTAVPGRHPDNPGPGCAIPLRRWWRENPRLEVDGRNHARARRKCEPGLVWFLGVELRWPYSRSAALTEASGMWRGHLCP